MNEDLKFLMWVFICVVLVSALFYNMGIFSQDRLERCRIVCNEETASFRMADNKMGTVCICSKGEVQVP